MTTDPHTQRAFLRGTFASIAVSAAVLLLLAKTQTGEWLENGTLDARTRWTAQPAKADPRIVIIDIDNASLAALQEKLGRWPWTRRVWTEVIRYVSRGKPNAIVMDAILSGTESEAVDSELAQVARNSKKLVLGFSFLSTKVERVSTDSQQAQLALLEEQASPGGLGVPVPAEAFEPNLPMENLARAAASLGCVNSSPDRDGTVRRVPLQFEYQAKHYGSLAVRGADLASPGQQAVSWHKKSGIFDASYVERNGIRTPVDEQGRVLVLWHGGSNVYPRLPIWKVICSIYPDQCASEVQTYPPEFFQDKIVLIGASAAGSYEARPMPFDEQAPGFLAHAAAIDNLLHGEAIRPTPEWLLFGAVLAMACTGGLLQYRLRSISTGAAIVLAAFVVYVAIALAAFRGLHFAVPVVAPCLALVVSYGSTGAARYVTTGRELRRTRGVLDRYVAPQLVSYVMSNLDSFRLNGDKRELTILISDVRNFTTMTEQSDPMELISLLDDYLAAMTDIIFRHNGIVDKFIGDGILAYWGAFTPGENHAEEAAEAALEMIERVKQLNEQWAKQGKGPIAIGIGVNTGSVIFGNIGRGKKIEFTVIGDAVNLAARLEGLNKEFHTSIVISETTRRMLGEAGEVRSLGGVKVKGKTVETLVYELVGFKRLATAGAPVASKIAVETVK
jgi:adenylate cyclase